MQSTTHITKYTPAVLRAVCKKQKLKKKEFRFNTLKRVECELANLLTNPESTLHEADQEALTDLHRAVRMAIGEE